MQRIHVDNLVCDPIALQAEEAFGFCQCSQKQLLASSSAVSSCFKLIGQTWAFLQKANKPRAFTGTRVDAPGCFLLSLKWIFQWTAQGFSYNGTFSQACTFPWKLLIKLFFLSVRKMRKQCRIAGKAGSCFNPLMSCSASPSPQMSLCSCLAWAEPLDACIGSCWEPDTRALTTVHNPAAALQVLPSKLGRSLLDNWEFD